MPKYDIWLEGYAIQGNSGTARLIAEQVSGETFKQAVENFSKTKEGEDYGIFDRKRLTFWGCKVFDNEQDAKRTFG